MRGPTPRPSGARAGARLSARMSHFLCWCHWPATHDRVAGRDRAGREPHTRRSEGVEVAAAAALAPKSLESAGYPQRRVAACIQTDSSACVIRRLAVGWVGVGGPAGGAPRPPGRAYRGYDTSPSAGGPVLGDRGLCP